MSRSRGRVISYLAAYALGLVLGLVCHIGDSGVAGNQLRSSRVLEFLAVLVLLVPCTNICGSLLQKPALPFEIRIEINDFSF